MVGNAQGDVAIAFSDFFAGSLPPQTTTTVGQTSNLPLWYASYAQQLISNAATQAQQPFQPYQGPRIAPFTDTQNQAFQYGLDNATSWQQPLQQAQTQAQTASNYDPSQLQQFMNPYMSAVTDEVERLGMRNLTENLNPALQSTFIGSGGFGSQRNMDLTERLFRDVGADIRGQQAQLLNTGYQNAQQQYGNWANTGLKGSEQMGALAQQQQGQHLGTAAGMEAIGAQQQNLGQQSLNTAYQDYLTQQQWPWQQMGALSSLMQGMQMPQSVQTTTTAPYSGSSMTASPLAQLAGLFALGKGATG